MNKKIKQFALMSLVAASFGTANAGMMLSLDDGLSTLSIADNGVGDNDATVGVISYTGSLGGFDIVAEMGFSKPITGIPELIHLHSVTATFTGAGTGMLDIGLTDTDFTLPMEALAFGIGGSISAGTVSASAWADDANGEFGKGVEIASFSDLSGVAFSADSSKMGLGLTDPYSVSIFTTVKHTSAGVSSFDAAINVPEPSIVALFGLGLVGVGVAGRRRLSK